MTNNPHYETCHAMLTILATLLPIFALIALGLALDRAPFISRSMGACLNQFVYWVGFPALLFNQMAEIHSESVSWAFLAGLALSVALSWALTAAVTTRVFKEKKDERIMFAFLATFPNFAYMGLTIIALLRPGNSEALLAASLTSIVYIALMLFADAKLELARHKDTGLWRAMPRLALSLLKNPMFMGAVIGAALGLSGLTLPRPARVFFSMLGGTAAPCALISMGMLLGVQSPRFRNISAQWLKGQALLHGIKLILVPALAFFSLFVCGVRGIPLGVGTVIAATPIGVAAYVISEKYRLLPEESSLGIVLNTALSVVTLPLTILLMESLGFL